MIEPDEALGRVLEAVRPNAPRRVPVAEARGLQLAEPVCADSDHPTFDRAMMDGYAVATADAGRTVRRVGEIAAGQAGQRRVQSGRCLEIMTGAPCPPGTEAVVPKEEVRLHEDAVILPKRITPGQHIEVEGSHCRAGQVVLEPGHSITPLAIAVMASFGLDSVRVVPRPSMAIITTGTEVIPVDRTPRAGQIRDSNGPMLVAMACDAGLDRPEHLHAGDQLEQIEQALWTVADREIVLLTGGVSVGTYDLVPQALERYGAEPVFHKVKQKPGKPLLLARRGSQVVFGLPGNRLSCHFCFHRYVAAAVRRIEGKPSAPGPMLGQLTAPAEPDVERTYFVAAVAVPAAGSGATAGSDAMAGSGAMGGSGASGGSPAAAGKGRQALHGTPPAAADERRWRVRPLGAVSSADVFRAARANCYAELPPGSAPLPAGHVVRFTWIGRTFLALTDSEGGAGG